MAQQTIGIGAAPNDGTGDPIRDAFDKCNDNFTELYTGLTGLLDFKGSTDCSTNPNYPAASKGDFYLVSVAGKIGGASGIDVEIADTYFATADNAGGDQATVGTSWTVVQGNVAYTPVNKAGDTMTGDLIVPDEAYGVGWDASLEVPTKNAVYDKIESLAGGGFTAASTTEVLTGTDSAKGGTPDSIAALWEQGSDVASAGTISLGEGGYFNITGTTTITDIDFATDKAGRKAWAQFAGILTLTHNASTLILPTGANITTAAGDTACFVSEGTDIIRCVAYNRADGTALAGGSGTTSELDYDPPTTTSHATERKTAASFTASSADVAGKGLLFSLNPTGAGDKHIGRYKTPPATPFTLVARARHTPHNTTAEVGLMLHNTSNNRNLRVACIATRQVFSQSWSNLETFNATIGTGPTGAVSELNTWLKITVDGSGNVAFFWSNDGAYWKACGTTTLATYLTAAGGSLDEVGVYARANGSGGTSGAVFYYYDES